MVRSVRPRQELICLQPRRRSSVTLISAPTVLRFFSENDGGVSTAISCLDQGAGEGAYSHGSQRFPLVRGEVERVARLGQSPGQGAARDGQWWP